MSITHEEAHWLIQLNMENLLNSQESAALSAHLRDCSECEAYASEIKEVTTLLLPMMKRQWSAQPVPLSIASLTGRREKKRTSAFLTIRKAAMALIFVAFFFSAWQFVLSGPALSPQPALQVPPPPTPSRQSAQSTGTKVTLQSCEMIIYPVQKSDTLASLARQFSVSEDTIRELNHLPTNEVRPSMELVIPICNFTPTGTFHPATFTTTYTPLLNASTSTPGG
jgi:LysM repeat protein